MCSLSIGMCRIFMEYKALEDRIHLAITGFSGPAIYKHKGKLNLLQGELIFIFYFLPSSVYIYTHITTHTYLDIIKHIKFNLT